MRLTVCTFRSGTFGTQIVSRDVVGIGKGYRAVIIENPKHRCFHAVLSGCGAIVGTESTREKLVAQVRMDVKQGDKAVMREQMAQAKKWERIATIISNEEFFDKFFTYPSRTE